MRPARSTSSAFRRQPCPRARQPAAGSEGSRLQWRQCRRLAGLSLSVNDAAGRPVLVAGSSSPTVRVGAGESTEVALEARASRSGSLVPENARPLHRHGLAPARASGGRCSATRFGFRRLEASPHGLLLNGQPIFLTGFNRHDDSPSTAMAFDPSIIRRDLEQMERSRRELCAPVSLPPQPSRAGHVR